jgi:hypothetical protein
MEVAYAGMDILILCLIVGFFLFILFLSTIVGKLESIRKDNEIQVQQNDRIIELLKEMSRSKHNL